MERSSECKGFEVEWRRKIILPKKTSFGNHEMVSVGRTLQGKREQALRNTHTHTNPIGENKVEKS